VVGTRQIQTPGWTISPKRRAPISESRCPGRRASGASGCRGTPQKRSCGSRRSGILPLYKTSRCSPISMSSCAPRVRVPHLDSIRADVQADHGQQRCNGMGTPDRVGRTRSMCRIHECSLLPEKCSNSQLSHESYQSIDMAALALESYDKLTGAGLQREYLRRLQAGSRGRVSRWELAVVMPPSLPYSPGGTGRKNPLIFQMHRLWLVRLVLEIPDHARLRRRHQRAARIQSRRLLVSITVVLPSSVRAIDSPWKSK